MGSVNWRIMYCHDNNCIHEFIILNVLTFYLMLLYVHVIMVFTRSHIAAVILLLAKK